MMYICRSSSSRVLSFLWRSAGVAALLCGAFSAIAANVGIEFTSVHNANGSGNSNGDVRLGATLTLPTAMIDLPNDARTWDLQGAGTLVGGGAGQNYAIYTAPQVMPENPKVTIIVKSTTTPVVTASYTVTLINPVPVVTGSNPDVVVAGRSVQITLKGSGFVPGTVVLDNGVAVSSAYQSPTSIVAQLSAATGASSVAIQATNPEPGGGESAAALTVQTAGIQFINVHNGNGSANNNGQVLPGATLTLPTSITELPNNGRSWSLQGPGTLVGEGSGANYAIYTAPAVLPGNTQAIVTVTANTTPAVSASYTISLVNPMPIVNVGAPTQLQSDATQTLTLSGSGFLANTSVKLNGAYLPYTYVNANTMKVQVPVPANASGSVPLLVNNPGPGGGTFTFQQPVESSSISLTATDSQGTNTGTAELGIPLTMTAAVNGSAQTAVNWSLTGYGAITSAGVYEIGPMPSDRTVTIRATLASNSAVTASYTLSVVNPLPQISSTSTEMLTAGATSAVTFKGRGFVPQTVIQVNGASMPTTYQSSTSVLAQVSVPANQGGNLSIRAENPAPGGGTGGEYEQAVSTPTSLRTAGRILDQTTFGATTSLIQHVQQEGVAAWLSEQYNTPQTYLATVPQNFASYCGDAENCTESEWWQTVLTGNDQLRQRVGFALSEMFVVSASQVSGWGAQYYSNLLAGDAFTNWYKIMNDVTLSPAMGLYLNMVNSWKPEGNEIANENYARENMQLFNMGLYLLNQDGSEQLNGNGQPIPAYSEAQVQAFARLYTGWTFANTDCSNPGHMNAPTNYYCLMVPEDYQHDMTSKTLLNGTTLPAGQGAEQDLSEGLTNIFNHENVPPFVCKQLIQHLVKSDPSPAYVSRVAGVFINNGNGVRGDMKSVLTAIFTDSEARAGDTAQQASDGHLREPLLWMTDVMRALGYVNLHPNNYYEALGVYVDPMGQRPYQAPSVFNFFPPSYVIPGAGLNAPEFGLENTASVTDRLNLADAVSTNTLYEFNADMSATSPLGKIAVSQGPAALVNALSQLFLYGTMDENTASAITNEISGIKNNPTEQVELAVYLVITSSEYKVVH